METRNLARLDCIPLLILRGQLDSVLGLPKLLHPVLDPTSQYDSFAVRDSSRVECVLVIRRNARSCGSLVSWIQSSNAGKLTSSVGALAVEDDLRVAREEGEEGGESLVERLSREVDGATDEGDLRSFRVLGSFEEEEREERTSKSVRRTSTTRNWDAAEGTATMREWSSSAVMEGGDALGAGKAACQEGSLMGALIVWTCWFKYKIKRRLEDEERKSAIGIGEFDRNRRPF